MEVESRGPNPERDDVDRHPSVMAGDAGRLPNGQESGQDSNDPHRTGDNETPLGRLAGPELRHAPTLTHRTIPPVATGSG